MYPYVPGCSRSAVRMQLSLAWDEVTIPQGQLLAQSVQVVLRSIAPCTTYFGMMNMQSDLMCFICRLVSFN